MIAETGGVLEQQRTKREQQLAASVAAVKQLRYRAVWRSKQLLILPIDCHPFRQSVSAVLEGDRDRLLSCLKHSHVRRLLLSPELPVEELYFWAELGYIAGLPVLLRAKFTHRERPSMLKRALDVIIALALLMLFSPLMLMTSIFSWITIGRVFDRDWSISPDLSFYKNLSFVLPSEYSSTFHYGFLANLPRLINVLRGEIGLSHLQLNLNDKFSEDYS